MSCKRRGSRLVAIALLALCGLSIAKAAPSEDETVKRAARMAMMAHSMGACERHLPKEDVDRNLALITKWADPNEPELAQLTAYFAKWYARGRAETNSWSVDRCIVDMKALAAASEAASAK